MGTGIDILRPVLAIMFAGCAVGFFMVDAAQIQGDMAREPGQEFTQWDVFRAALRAIAAARKLDPAAFAILWIVAAPVACACRR